MLGLELAVAGHLLLQANATVTPQTPTTCPAQKTARVDVRWRSEPVEFDFGRSIDNLNHSDVDTVNPYGTHVATDVGGLMSGSIKYESNIQISSVRYPVGNVTCLWVDKVTVDIVIDPIIMIAAEHPEGSCEHNAILEHEYKHVAVDRSVVKDHLQAARQATALAVQKVGVVGPKKSDSANEYKQKMTTYIQDQLKLEMDSMYADRKKRQAAIDTKEEYDRVDGQCGGNGQPTQPAQE